MWLEKGDGFAAVLYAPSVLNTEINDVKISIEALTQYPFSDQIEYQINVSDDLNVPFYFRETSLVECPGNNSGRGQYYARGRFL